MISLNTNVAAMMTQRHLNHAAEQNVASQRNLVSGYRINSASDDAAGLQISNTLDTQTRGLDVALSNANSAYSAAQTAEAALHESSEMLQRLRDLGLQAANGVVRSSDRDSLQYEVDALKDELDRVAVTTTFAGKHLFDGSYGSQSFLIGADVNSISLTLKDLRTDVPKMGGHHYLSGKAVDADWQVDNTNRHLQLHYLDAGGEQSTTKIEFKAGDNLEQVASYINARQSVVNASVTEERKLQFFAASLNAPQGVDIEGSLATELDVEPGQLVTVDDVNMTTVGGAQLAVSVADAALRYVDSHRSEIGGFQNRISGTMDNLNSINSSVTASKSRIRDTDFARESTEMVRSQVLQDATTALLAQAKQRPREALGLLS